MRIERLDLLAFGPFTELSLPLGAPGVHVVFGPNEAGKSTALRALDQLFYGIDRQTRDDFVHAKPDIRLGAALRDDAGGRLEFVRLKRDRDSLVAPDGTPLDEDVLRRLLHGVDRAAFNSTFALNLAELQSGGRELLAGRGEIGEALLAARSNHDLGALRRELEEERDALFLPRGHKQVIKQALKRYAELRSTLREAQTPPRTYQRLSVEIEAAEERTRESKRRLDERRAELRELERLAQALPSLRERADKLRRVAELEAEGPLAAAEFAERLPRVEEQRGTAEEALAETAADLAAKRAELDELSVDPQLLDAAAEIARLARSRERIEADGERLAALDRAAARARARARSLLLEIRPEASPEDPAAFTVDRATRERVDALAERHADLRTRLEDAREEVARRQRRHRAELDGLESLGDPDDGAAVAAALDAVPATLLDDLDAVADAVHASAAARDRVAAEAGWAAEDPAALAAARAPSRRQVAEHRDRHRDTVREHQQRVDRAAELRAELEDARALLAELARDEAVPTEEALLRARSARDALWRRVRDGEPGTAPRDAYERAVAEADALADRALAGARRVVERQETQRRIADLAAGLEHAEEEAAASARTVGELAERWRKLWPDPVLPAPDLESAETVLDQLAELRRHHEEHTAASRGLADRRDRAAAHAEQLGRALRAAGADTPTADSSDAAAVGALLSALQRLAGAERDRRERAAREREEQLRAVAEAERSLTDAQARLDAAHEAMRAWEEEWHAVAASLDLPAERLPKEALGDLDQLARVAALTADAERDAAEAEALREGIAAFHDAVRAVLGACGASVPETDAELRAALDSLRGRAEANGDRERRRAALVEDLRDLEERQRKRKAQYDGAESELDRMRAETGAESTAQLRAAVERGRTAAKLRAEVELLAATLASSWDGGIGALEARAAQVDEETLGARLRQLREEITGLDDEYAEAVRALEAVRGERRAIDGSARAARAAQEREEVLAQITEAAEEYTRLVLARTILLECMEEHRRANQDPILGRAQELFEALTLGRFRELRAETAEDGTTTLLARRAGGEPLAPGQMSEGTCDQLYLALRLATLERYAAEGRAMPFVLDDVFMTFDEERTAAGLRVLDSLADRFQPVVFTHHRHLADLALEVLPEGRAHVHRLRRFAPEGRAAAVAAPPGAARSADPPRRRCRECGSPFAHRGRGRPPVKCPDCR